MSYQKPFVCSVSVLCSQICTLKLNLRLKIGDLYNLYSKVVLWKVCLRKYVLLFLAELTLLTFHNNIIVKSLEKVNERNLLKICLQATYPTDFCTICIHFYYEKKVKIFYYFRNQ